MSKIINPFCDRCGRISPRWLNANRYHAGTVVNIILLALAPPLLAIEAVRWWRRRHSGGAQWTAGPMRGRIVPAAEHLRSSVYNAWPIIRGANMKQDTKKSATTRDSARVVDEHLKAANRAFKAASASPSKAKNFLVRAGILNKSGNGLSSRYR